MMKKKYLWLFASLFVAAFTLTACGSDDDDNSGTGGSLVGTWAATDDGKGDGYVEIKGYLMTYEFKSNGTFTCQSNYYGYNKKTDDYDGLAYLLSSYDRQPPTGYSCEDLFRLRFTGSYTTSGNMITMTFKKWWEYDYGRNGTEEDRWGGPDGTDVDKDIMGDIANPLTISYSVNGNTLTLGNAQNGTYEWKGSEFYQGCKMLVAGTLTKW